MEALLVKIFATALAFSLVVTRPDAVTTHLDPVSDQATVVQLLRDGCAHVRQALDIEKIDLDSLIDTVMADKQAAAGDIAAFKGIKFADLKSAYQQFCKNEPITSSVVNVGQVIEFYNRATANLPDPTRLRGLQLPGMTTVLDTAGAKFTELFERDHRRQWVPLRDIPEHVQRAFIAAEDKRFYQHHGVDERSVIRAFLNMLAEPGRRQGGSTITQQVVKNLLVGDNVSYERKIREAIVASRVEGTLSKQEILEIYLNSIYFGRSSRGIELAAQAYFGKPAKDLTIAEGAFLAGLAKGPGYFNPDRHRQRAQGRLAYVLSRMNDDEAITEKQMAQAQAKRLNVIPLVRARRTTGYHFVDQLSREAKAVAGINSLTATSYTVRTTIRPDLQRAAEAALQEGLAQYELGAGRARFGGAEANLADTIRRLQADTELGRDKRAWQTALGQARLPLYDVHWDRAVVVEKTRARNRAESIRVGLRDGRTLPLSIPRGMSHSQINLFDVLYVRVVDAKGRQAARAELRARTTVQGAAVILENKSGRVLAMVGGFSYPLSQLNRATQSRRQPGSSFKPMTYLAALMNGLQPNTLVMDAPVAYPPINGDDGNTRPQDWWAPRNYEGGYYGEMTLRRALEQSRNIVTARLLDGGVAGTLQESLDRVCALAVEAQLYTRCERFYPFVLGAQPVRAIDMAAFYAAIYNEGGRPTPHLIESITKDGRPIYQAKEGLSYLTSVDRASMFQLRTILQGVVARGTAHRLSALANFIGGKTGTTDQFNDAWFVGFSNDVTIAVWVGYDNANGRRTLGPGQAGSRVALPIFDSLMRAVWEHYAAKTMLVGPSPEAKRRLVALPIDASTGERLEDRGRGAFLEHFRLDDSGQVADAQYRLASRYDYGVGLIDASQTSNPFSMFLQSGEGPWSTGRRPGFDNRPVYDRPARQEYWGSGLDQRFPRGAPLHADSPYINRPRLPVGRAEPEEDWRGRRD